MELIGEKVEDIYKWDFNEKSSIDSDFDDKTEKIHYKYIVKNPFVVIDINTIKLGFEDNNSNYEPYFSNIDWWQECTSYQETFEGLTEWIIDNFKPIIDKEVSTNLKLNPPFEYVALVYTDCHVEMSVDWESGISDVDYVEIVLNKIIEL